MQTLGLKLHSKYARQITIKSDRMHCKDVLGESSPTKEAFGTYVDRRDKQLGETERARPHQEDIPVILSNAVPPEEPYIEAHMCRRDKIHDHGHADRDDTHPLPGPAMLP